MTSSFFRFICIQSTIMRTLAYRTNRESCLKTLCNHSTRNISISALRLQSEAGEEQEGENVEKRKRPVDPSKDRSVKIPLEVGMRYMESQAYKETYGDEPVWKPYRRNQKYAFTPRKTRRSCTSFDVISTGSPCPICRDEYLVIDYRNVKLLRQFISPYSDEVLETQVTGVCQRMNFALLVAIEKAKDCGYLDFYVPKRVYNYEDYYPQEPMATKPSTN